MLLTSSNLIITNKSYQGTHSFDEVAQLLNVRIAPRSGLDLLPSLDPLPTLFSLLLLLDLVFLRAVVEQLLVHLHEQL